MAHDDIDKMNHRLATEVMGWEVKYFDDDRPYRRIENGDTYEPIDINGSFWNPYKDLNQAMMCVEKIIGRKANGWDGEMIIYQLCLSNDEDKWDARLCQQDGYYLGDSPIVQVINDSPALAICKVILEALDK